MTDLDKKQKQYIQKPTFAQDLTKAMKQESPLPVGRFDSNGNDSKKVLMNGKQYILEGKKKEIYELFLQRKILTPSEVRETIQIHPNALKSLLLRLVNNGLIVRIERGKYQVKVDSKK